MIDAQRFGLTAEAEEDLIAIWDYIALDNPNAADRLLMKLKEKFQLLADNPELGATRPDIAKVMRYLATGNYLLLYRVKVAGVDAVIAFANKVFYTQRLVLPTRYWIASIYPDRPARCHQLPIAGEVVVCSQRLRFLWPPRRGLIETG